MIIHKIAIAFIMPLSEFLDFDKLNDYSFDDVEIETQKRILNEIHPNKA